MLFYGYFWVAFISLGDFFRKYAYKRSKKIKFIGTTDHWAGRQAVEPDDRPSSQPTPDIQYICENSVK